MNTVLVYREDLFPGRADISHDLNTALKQDKDWGWKTGNNGRSRLWIREDAVIGNVKELLRNKYSLPMWDDPEIPLDAIRVNTNNNDAGIKQEEVEMDFTHYTNPEDGKKYVRVSRVLDIIADKGIQEWREVVGGQEANRRVREAADWGNEVHDLTKRIDNGENIEEIPERSFNMIMRYLAWKDKWVDKVIFVEKTFYSRKYGFACTIDRGVIMKGASVPVIIDLKTGAIRKKKFGLQVAGGYKLVAKENGIETGKAIILPLDKKNNDADDLEAIQLEDGECQKVFLETLGVYRYMTGEKW